MKKVLTSLFLLLVFFSAKAQDNPQWLRYSAISPDGSMIAFCYKGDIYTVPSSGGTATALTLSESYEVAPVWSHDGKSIAFASDRYGNFDVFIMPSTGGEAKRLTFHSTSEMPSAFSPDDKNIIFSASRQDLAANVQFPISVMSELYTVPANGGKVSQIISVPAVNAVYSSDGSKIIYQDVKGYEDKWRKHHTSSVTRDIWVYDVNKKTYTQLSQFKGEDTNPLFGNNDDDFYYLSEQNGESNIYKSSLSNPTLSTPLTNLTKHPVRFLTKSKDDKFCFSYNGEVYTMLSGSEPQKVQIKIAGDGRETLDKFVPVNTGFSEATLSPNGKEYAYVFRGEIFVSSVESGVTKRITNTPYQERSVSFSPDGRSLLFAAEKDKSWNIYKMTIARKEEPYFFTSTVLNMDTVIATDEEEFQPSFSPDGKEVAYLADRTTLKVINLESKKVRTILPGENNYSYSDGDQYYTWSPDGKWFLVQFGYKERMFVPEVGLIASDGKGELKNLTQSGYDDYMPKWSADGSMMVWGSDYLGTRRQDGNMSSSDVFAMFFTKEAYDKFRLSKEEAELRKEAEDKQDKDKKADEDKSSKKKKDKDKDKNKEEVKEEVKPVKIDFDKLTDRYVKLTANTSPLNDWLLSKDCTKLYYVTAFDDGYDIWVNDFKTKESKMFCKLGAKSGVGFEMSKDGKFLLLLADGRAMKLELESCKLEPLKASGEMLLKKGNEREYIFDHCWRQFKEKFYKVDLHGVDWNFYYKEYRRFLPYINNNYDFSEMMSEMLGEINASHTGCRYYGFQPNSDETAGLGVFYDNNYTGKGMKISEIIAEGPLDKAVSKVKAGNIIEKIDGIDIDNSLDYYQLLNRKADKTTLLDVYDPSTKTRWQETVKPIHLYVENELLYQRWVENRRKETDSLSDGKIGYIHVRGMDDESMREVFKEALGRCIEKDAIIIDTRFNGGGNIHEQLSDFLSGKKYIDVIPHGQYIGSEPQDKWIKPSIVVINEACYSDAHLFPVAYKLKNIGKTIGMPVPGTGTFVWWERQIDPTLVYGIPMGGWRMPDGKFCENSQLEPDIKVLNTPDMMTTGVDQQIEAAVKELLKK